MIKIISGGQTGVDQAALDAAITCGFEHGGWLPKGRKTESGPLPKTYNLSEMSSGRYRDRTMKNIISADGTLIISRGSLTGGSALTSVLALEKKLPCFHLDFNKLNFEEAVKGVSEWLVANNVEILNVAGPRASNDPEIYSMAKCLVEKVLQGYKLD